MALPQCLLIVTAQVDADIEDEWNRWYDAEHLPAALACPGVLAGRRYVSRGPVVGVDRGQRDAAETRIYTTIYELASPQAVETPEFRAMRGWYRFAGGVRSQTKVIAAL
jgi:hypothetical protein